MERKKTRQIRIGKTLKMGGNAPIVIQSMTNTDTKDVDATLRQIERLHEAGCDLVRCAVPDEDTINALAQICKKSPIPVVADIHFNHKLALQAMDAGVHKIRINPGNINTGNSDAGARFIEILKKAKECSIPIRIGVNAGSLEKGLLEKYGDATPEALVESAMNYISFCEKYSFRDIVISIKSSSVVDTMKAYQLISEKCNYPLHIGVTEAGTEYMGTIKSSIAIGGLLAQGIGDTMRVSLTEDPVREVEVAKNILRSMGMYKEGIQLISCPTCGRTQIDLIKIAKEVEQRIASIKGKKLTVAVMGCAVNGPGEARKADIGITGGQGVGLLFRKGQIVRFLPQDQLIDALIEEINNFEEEEK